VNWLCALLTPALELDHLLRGCELQSRKCAKTLLEFVAANAAIPARNFKMSLTVGRVIPMALAMINIDSG
jgi:hypothetical protein